MCFRRDNKNKRHFDNSSLRLSKRCSAPASVAESAWPLAFGRERLHNGKNNKHDRFYLLFVRCSRNVNQFLKLITFLSRSQAAGIVFGLITFLPRDTD